jgi:hypothetical protein
VFIYSKNRTSLILELIEQDVQFRSDRVPEFETSMFAVGNYKGFG